MNINKNDLEKMVIEDINKNFEMLSRENIEKLAEITRDKDILMTLKKELGRGYIYPIISDALTLKKNKIR